MLDGKVAIVTGAAQGIGYSISESLAQAGSHVAVLDIAKDAALAAAETLPTRSIGLEADVSNSAAVHEAVKQTIEVFGHIDILVNNAGVCPIVSIEDITTEDWDRVMAINLRGPFLCSQAVIPAMRSQGSGKIINIASSAGQMGGLAVGLHYSTSKAGILGMTKSLARLLAPDIQVNAVSPGTTKSEMTASWSEDTIQGIVERIPAGRLGHPTDIASAVRFLASDEANFITGQTLSVNGGLLMI